MEFAPRALQASRCVSFPSHQVRRNGNALYETHELKGANCDGITTNHDIKGKGNDQDYQARRA